MAKEQESGISLKIFVDAEKSRVIYAESDSDFVDVLFSFLTIPISNIVSLASKPSSPVIAIGCFNNLYKSVESIDVQHFHHRTSACKSILLSPRNGVETSCSDLKLKIEDSDPTKFFSCSTPNCQYHTSLGFCHYANVKCRCGRLMDTEKYVKRSPNIGDENEGVFVKGANQFIISDDLRVTPVSTSAVLSLFSKQGVTSRRELEERILILEATQVKKLLIFALVSRTVLTDTFLKNAQCLKSVNTVDYCKFDSNLWECGTQHQQGEAEPISVKLIISKSRRIVCFAEVDKDFVNFLFSFLTVPIGHVAKQIHRDSSRNMSIDHLYGSVAGLSDHWFISNQTKQMLVSPSLAVSLCHRNDLLGINPPCNLIYQLRRMFYPNRRAFGCKDVT